MLLGMCAFHYFCSMTDNEIIQGLKRGDAEVTRRHFYDPLRVAYHVYNQRYALSNKTDMDFYSLAHDYYMRLLMGDWKQLEAKRGEVSLRTWLTNGFHYVILDKLKTFHPAGDDVESLRFDVPDDHFAEDVREMLEEVIDHHLDGDRQSQGLLRMILIGGYKSKEVAAQLGVTPSAVSQRYRQLMDKVVIPYFKRNYVSESARETMTPDLMAPEMMADESACYEALPVEHPAPASGGAGGKHRGFGFFGFFSKKDSSTSNKMQQTIDERRITPDFIKELGDHEIFVFGSNLAGMHGGGAAYIALKKFGAILGQGVGLQGQSYGIPTMQGGVETIAPYVDDFIAFAREHGELRFLVTRIGCGIAGFDAEDIAPLFRDAMDVENICLPRDFWEVLIA